MTGPAFAALQLRRDENALDQEDLARLLVTFRGVHAASATPRPTEHHAADALTPVYLFDTPSGMVYIKE